MMTDLSAESHHLNVTGDTQRIAKMLWSKRNFPDNSTWRIKEFFFAYVARNDAQKEFDRPKSGSQD